MLANKAIGTDILTGTGNRHLVNLISGKSKDDQTSSLNMQIHQKVLEPFMALKAAAAIEGFDLCICSAYRSFDRQRVIWNDKLAGLRPVLDQFSNPIDLSQLDDWQKIQAVLRWSALPGASRHHWGTDFDIYDAGAMIADYQIQLVPEECKGTGVFAPMHGWLNSMLPSKKRISMDSIDPMQLIVEEWLLSHGI